MRNFHSRRFSRYAPVSATGRTPVVPLMRKLFLFRRACEAIKRPPCKRVSARGPLRTRVIVPFRSRCRAAQRLREQHSRSADARIARANSLVLSVVFPLPRYLRYGCSKRCNNPPFSVLSCASAPHGCIRSPRTRFNQPALRSAIHIAVATGGVVYGQ